jgi:hypothetical protein
MPTKIQFHTEAYTRSHGHTPKGRGRWAFQIVELNDWEGEGNVYFTPCMTLTEAKKYIREAILREAEDFMQGDPIRSIDVDVMP